MDTPIARHDNPFHAGEQAVHERLGIRERMVGLGQRVIRTAMPEQHRRFFEQVPFMLVGSVDALGRPWASVRVGEPGFMGSPDPTRYSADMGTDFLMRIGDVASAALSRLRVLG